MRDVIPTAATPDTDFLFESMTRRTLAATRASGGRRVLDVASGFGQDARALAVQGGYAVAVEPSARMSRLARMQDGANGDPDPRHVRGFGDALPFASASFDAVFCKGALDHFDAPEVAIAEMARVTRHDGLVVLSVANFASLACRVSRGLDAWREGLLGRELPRGRRHYDVPHDHFTRYDPRPWCASRWSATWWSTCWRGSRSAGGLPSWSRRGLAGCSEGLGRRACSTGLDAAGAPGTPRLADVDRAWRVGRARAPPDQLRVDLRRPRLATLGPGVGGHDALAPSCSESLARRRRSGHREQRRRPAARCPPRGHRLLARASPPPASVSITSGRAPASGGGRPAFRRPLPRRRAGRSPRSGRVRRPGRRGGRAGQQAPRSARGPRCRCRSSAAELLWPACRATFSASIARRPASAARSSGSRAAPRRGSSDALVGIRWPDPHTGSRARGARSAGSGRKSSVSTPFATMRMRSRCDAEVARDLLALAWDEVKSPVDAPRHVGLHADRVEGACVPIASMKRSSSRAKEARRSTVSGWWIVVTSGKTQARIASSPSPGTGRRGPGRSESPARAGAVSRALAEGPHAEGEGLGQEAEASSRRARRS